MDEIINRIIRLSEEYYDKWNSRESLLCLNYILYRHALRIFPYIVNETKIEALGKVERSIYIFSLARILILLSILPKRKAVNWWEVNNPIATHTLKGNIIEQTIKKAIDISNLSSRNIEILKREIFYRNIPISNIENDLELLESILLEDDKPDWNEIYYTNKLFTDTGSKEYTSWFEIKKELFSHLKEIGLAFLYYDLEKIYKKNLSLSEAIPSHWNNYIFFNLSSSEHYDLDSIKNYITQGGVKNDAVRVLLLGPGGAGKTTMFDKLHGIKRAGNRSPTIGISNSGNNSINLDSEIFRNTIEVPPGLEIYLWDFGGQTIYHGFHKAFLEENCIFVIIVDSRHEQAPDDWLNQINHITSKNSKNVIIVTNEYENCFSTQNQNELIRRFSHLIDEESFHYINLLNLNNDTKESIGLKNKLLTKCIQSRTDLTPSTLRFIKGVEEIFSVNKFINLYEIAESLCLSSHEANKKVKIAKRLGHLTELGNSNKMCFDTNYLIEAGYKIISEGVFLNGCISEEELYKTIRSIIKSSIADAESLKDFLVGSDLCVKLNNNNEALYLFPDMMPTNEPIFVNGFIKMIQSDKEANDYIQIEFDYIPMGIIGKIHCKLIKLSSKEYTLISDLFWKDGALIFDTSPIINPLCLILIDRLKSNIRLIFSTKDQEIINDLTYRFWLILSELSLTSSASVFIGTDLALINNKGRSKIQFIPNFKDIIDRKESLVITVKGNKNSNIVIGSGRIENTTSKVDIDKILSVIEVMKSLQKDDSELLARLDKIELELQKDEPTALKTKIMESLTGASDVAQITSTLSEFLI